MLGLEGLEGLAQALKAAPVTVAAIILAAHLAGLYVPEMLALLDAPGVAMRHRRLLTTAVAAVVGRG